VSKMTGAELRDHVKRLLPRVRARFDADFHRSFVAPLAALSPTDRAAAFGRIGYRIAKQRAAQNLEFAPLLKSLARQTGDHELAEIAASMPPVPPASKSKARAELAEIKRALAQGVRRIRKIIKEETRMARVPRKLTVAISAEILECKPGEIEKVIDGK
jgi:hypothetical protein